MKGHVLRAGSHPAASILKLILAPLTSSSANSTAILSEVRLWRPERLSNQLLKNTLESVNSCRDAPDDASADGRLKITSDSRLVTEDLLRSSHTGSLMRTSSFSHYIKLEDVWIRLWISDDVQHFQTDLLNTCGQQNMLSTHHLPDYQIIKQWMLKY